MLCHRAAEFFGPGGLVFRVKKEEINLFIYAPEWVKETFYFKWLLQDGSIVIGVQEQQIKQLENDPMEGIGADGKKLEESQETQSEPVEVVQEEAHAEAKPRTRRARKKSDAE